MKTLAPLFLAGLMAAVPAVAQEAAKPADPAAATPAPAAAPAADAAPAAPAPPAAAPAPAAANGPDTSAPTEQRNGAWYTADGNPSFKITEDGTLDYATFQGYIRYTGNCMQCHGPDGLGSTYAPALKTSVMNMDYATFLGTVAGGKQQVGQASNLVMPSFGADKNVMCYLDNIYSYLLARGEDKIDRGRPQKKEAKPKEFADNENSCMQ